MRMIVVAFTVTGLAACSASADTSEADQPDEGTETAAPAVQASQVSPQSEAEPEGLDACIWLAKLDYSICMALPWNTASECCGYLDAAITGCFDRAYPLAAQ